MKTLLTTFTLVFTVMFSSPGFAEWTKLTKNEVEYEFYLDFERIRKHDGFVYYWVLKDYFKPNRYGHLSAKMYTQGDCKSFRYKFLGVSLHIEQMGGGEGVRHSPENPEWRDPDYDIWESVLNISRSKNPKFLKRLYQE